MNSGNKVFYTKYALTSGIEERVLCDEDDNYYWLEPKDGEIRNRLLARKNEVYETIEKAGERAEEMRIKKLQSLDKQVKKISSMTFKFIRL